MIIMGTSLTNRAALNLSPQGNVYFDNGAQAGEALPEDPFNKIKSFFDKGASFGLLHLGIHEFPTGLPPSFVYWQTFTRQFLAEVCKITQSGDGVSLPVIPCPERAELQKIVDQALPFQGIEYLHGDVLWEIWKSLTATLQAELIAHTGGVQAYLQRYNSRWNLVGRVCFHLAENKKDEQRPFAFLATYTTHLTQQATAQHLPLMRALQEYAGEKSKAALLALLLPVQKAAEQSPFIKELVETSAIFRPQAWTAREAHRFLKDIPLMESSGVMVRVPNWWNSQRPSRPQVVITLGNAPTASVGLSALLDFDMRVALNDETLSTEEWEALLNAPEGLVKIKGTWVEVDRSKLESVLAHWKQIRHAAKNGLSMAESLRLLAGANTRQFHDEDLLDPETMPWSSVIAGNWLHKILSTLRNPQQDHEKAVEEILKGHLHAALRPYQKAGVQWLWLLYQLKLGGCLADDMGLGKTIQVLALMLLTKYLVKDKRQPHLLIVPASLLGNWLAEAKRFAPSLNVLIAHRSAYQTEELDQEKLSRLCVDVVLTTYGNSYRLNSLKAIAWDLVILDEAQSIKNPGTKQARAVKELKSQARFALTGTPIENRLSDLWSLFDFTSPGLLGSSKDFSNYTKKAGQDNSSAQYTQFVSTLRGLTQPYILRRLKNDKKIISDLPDKTEVPSYCSLSAQQVQLYQQAITELSKELDMKTGIERQGLVLSYLVRLKQICNHPVQWLGYGEYTQETSGKFNRLQEICAEIAAKQEKVLIFTQFKEIIPALSALLTTVFGREGLMLHGGTAIKQRPGLVARFQEEQGPPFFILSLKAGGTGLNLTRASHVIHFDRGWNPAVENQATDRAYRIGQKHPVLVHKFICCGTIEEKIDALMTSKKTLSKDMLDGSEELALTELTNAELINLISLDIHKALGES
jgi:hypothetical protein